MTTLTNNFCSVCAHAAGLDPGGYAGTAYETILATEMPLPWSATLFSDPARMPPEVLALMEHILAEYQQGQGIRIRPLAIAPDAAYSQPGVRRVLCWRRPAGPFAHFSRAEYLVPEAQIGPLIGALTLAPKQLPHFAGFLQAPDAVRDLLVCTHGNVDAACATFGYPTYKHLRQLAAESGGKLRAWRTTHFGGHVFAPTLIDLPHGSYWAYVGRAQAEQLVQQDGAVARLRGHYRGWAGLPTPFLQVLERALFMQHGWRWRSYAKQGFVLAQDAQAEPSWAEVRLVYTAPNGESGAVRARVAAAHTLDTPHSSGDPETFAYPQYRITQLYED